MHVYKTDQFPQGLITSTLKVCVLVATFNHSKFIGRCLDSILGQKFDGDVGVIILDDCSHDNTMELVQNILGTRVLPSNFSVHYVLRSANQYSLGRLQDSYSDALNSIKSQFVAICDGDDAWTDPRKLQIQYDFLLANPEYSACGHDSSIVDDCGQLISVSKLSESMKRDFERIELQCCDCWILSNTNFFRGNIEFPLVVGEIPNGDNWIWSVLGMHGKFKYLPNVKPSIYTSHQGGVWSQKKPLNKLLMQAETYLRIGRYHYENGNSMVGAKLIWKSRGLLNKLQS